jgi:hypothetical protein
MSKEIDYLFEDPVIDQQKYALVTIVGPHMPQKCKVWGLKIRGTTQTMEQAKKMTQRLMKIDNNYDIYTVEVGKFFPLNIEPHQVSEVEYENKELNNLIKSYLENREIANQQWHQRKNEMIKEAIREGKEQEEMAKKPEHPIAVLHRIIDLKTQVEEAEKYVEDLKNKLQLSEQKFGAYSESEQKEARLKLETGETSENTTGETSENTTGETSENTTGETSENTTAAEISENTTAAEISSEDSVSRILNEINLCELEFRELSSLKDSVTSVSLREKINQQLRDLTNSMNELKLKLNDTKSINNYINSNYASSEWDYLTK